MPWECEVVLNKYSIAQNEETLSKSVVFFYFFLGSQALRLLTCATHLCFGALSGLWHSTGVFSNAKHDGRESGSSHFKQAPPLTTCFCSSRNNVWSSNI